MAGAAGLALAAAVRRLVHDLKEVQEHPVPNVSALPLDDDIFTWHGNVRSSPEGTLCGAPIHFILKFPPDYPHKQPEVRLLQPIPHPNLTRAQGVQVLGLAAAPAPAAAGSSSGSSAAGGLLAHVSRPLPREARYRLAMWDCIPGHNSWCSAYSVLSVLLQLQVFLLDEDLAYDTQATTPQQAIATAQALTCPHCPHAGTTPASVHPPFPTQQQLEGALQLRGKVTVGRPFVPARSRATAEQLRQHQRPLLAVTNPALVKRAAGRPSSSSGGNSSPCPSDVDAVPSSSSSSSSTSTSSGGSSGISSTAARGCAVPSSTAAVAGGDMGAGDGWTTVQHRHHHSTSSSSSSSMRGGFSGRGRGGGSGRGGAAGAGRGVGGRGAAAHTPTAPQQPAHQQQQLVTGGAFAALLAPAAAPTTQQPAAQHPAPAAPVAAPAAAAATKAAKKNAARRARRQQQQQQADAVPAAAADTAAASGHPTPPTPQQLPPKPQQPRPQPQQQQQQGGAWVEVPSKSSQQQQQKKQQQEGPLQGQLQQLLQQPMQDLVAAAKAGTALQLPPCDDADADTAADSSSSWGTDQTSSSSSSSSCLSRYFNSAEDEAAAAAAAGPFALLGRDALLEVVCLLEPASVAALGSTCRALHAAVEDGAVWQAMMAKSFPGARLQPSRMTEWKAAFQLESAAILDELRCWVTRAGHEEDVLGLPLTYTVNPATKRVDYILAHPDVLSVTAFKMGVRVTPQGDKFDALLPLYLSAPHFNRALPHMAHLLPLLAPEAVGAGGRAPPPETWLTVLAAILNTQVVLLSDNGLAVSQRSLSVYCQVHRLLLAVAEHWALWPAVARRLDAFAASPAGRSKAATPNLGLLLPLLAVGNPARHSWGVLGEGLLLESLSRKVLWMCKKDPGLVQRFQAPKGAPADPQLVSGSWEGAAVSAKLISFHVAFLKLVACPRGATLESVMDSADALYGWPPAALGVRFQRVVARIQQLSSWQEWFVLLGRQPPSPQAMSDLLRWAWASGAAKGYHSASTDFSRIQRSGVSRILLKGQTYAMPPAANKVDLVVHYKWRPEVFVYYLDGAVLLMGPGSKLIEAVAWNHQSSTKTARPGAVVHSGDIMEFEQQKGHNNATINFAGLGPQVAEVFVTLSGWAGAMLDDIKQPYVQLKEPDTGVELCQVHLDSLSPAAKRSHKCIIMARFYRAAADGRWTVASVGSLCQGNTSDYGPMLEGCRAVAA